MKSRDSPERQSNVLAGIVEQELRRLYDGTIPWRTWLDRAARYGSYGFANTLLIAAQSRLATQIDTFDGWKARGRHVRKGEHGIRIIGEHGPHSVFDIAQTAGPPPAERRSLTAEQADRLLQATGVSHGVRRVEADSVAYLVRARFGCPPATAAFDPVRTWAGPDPYPTISAVGDHILRTADRIERLAAAYWSMHEAAQAFFVAHCAAGWVPAYLADRGLTDPARWEIGYAPKTRRALTDHLRTLGYPDDQIVQAGLARRSRSGKLYDTFRDRLTIPLRDHDATLTAFIARRPDDAPGPKYLNSPESPIFTKRDLLYTPPIDRRGPAGPVDAAQAASSGRYERRPLLVEGPFDAIAVAFAAPDEWIPYAPCGTAVTQTHAALLAERGDGGVVVAFDGDRAGREAAVRAWGVLSEVTGPLEAVVLDAGWDPAELLRDGGAEAVREALRVRVPLEDLVVDAKLARTGAALEQRVAAARAAARLIAALPADQAARQVARVAERLDLPPALVTEALVAAISPEPLR
jgi:DNA primase